MAAGAAAPRGQLAEGGRQAVRPHLRAQVDAVPLRGAAWGASGTAVH